MGQSLSWKKYFGDKAFYRSVLMIAVPVMIQNGITNFVNLLDNIMIGIVGTEQMSGASVVNQLIFVYHLCIFGGISGAGIFTAQFYGQKNGKGVQETFRYKLILGFILTVVTVVLFLSHGELLIHLYLKGDGLASSRESTMQYGLTYLRIMLLSFPAFMVVQSYAGTLRECGQTVMPMRAGIAAVFVNLCFNYLLIYGRFGFPRMGVAGAAAATVLSRYVELLIVLTWTHKHKKEYPFADRIFHPFYISANLAKKIFITGMPLLINETLWAAGVATLAQCYSVLGLSVVASLNIANTINNVFNIVLIAMGNAVAIMIGQLLGAGEMRQAQDADRKLIVFSVLSCMLVGIVMFFVAPVFPMVYNTDNGIRKTAADMIRVYAVFMPVQAFLNCAYFTLRAGGKTLITFLFDSAFIWGVSVSTAFLLTRLTSLPILIVFVIVNATDLLKCLVGYVLVKRGIWIQNIIQDT